MDEIDDFTFYLGFTKQLVLNLPNPKDRAIAASWLKKLREINENNTDKDNVHVEYLKLLLIAMHGNHFSAFFETLPPEGNLEPININEIISAIRPSVKSINYPFVYTSVSGDLCDFVAIQEISHYGLHGYYAISNEPLSNWIHTKNFSCNKDDNDLDFGKRIQPTAPISESIKKSEMENAKESENENKTSSTEILKEDLSVGKRDVMRFETRPCWGSNRYVERLIDESPHFISDIELSQADAFLYKFKDRKMKKVKKGSSDGPCLLSSKRRQVERMMDLPRCAIDPGEEKIITEKTHFTCRPKKKQMEININCVDPCLSEDTEDEDDTFIDPLQNEYKRGTSIKNRIASYKNYFANVRSGQTSDRTAEPVIEKDISVGESKMYNSKLKFDDNLRKFSSQRRNIFHKSLPINPKVQENRANASIPPHLSHLRSRSPTLESYRTVSNLPARCDLNLKHEIVGNRRPISAFPIHNPHLQRQSMGSYGPISSSSRVINSLPQRQSMGSYGPVSGSSMEIDVTDQRRRSRSKTITSQDFVSLRTYEGRNSCENLFSNQRQIHSNLDKREEAHEKNLTSNGLRSKRVKFANDKNIRSYCHDEIN